ncbi:unnamed protein product [Ectocarpus sp. 12 AP-2014]
METTVSANAILAPAAALVAWTFFMLFWLVVTRLPAMAKAGINLFGALPGTRRGVDLEGLVPESVTWKSHNYTHLHEQPTLFYAIVAILAIHGGYSTLDLQLAWAFVAFRVAHSLVQSAVNYVPLRFTLFGGAAVCLLMMTYSALKLTL